MIRWFIDIIGRRKSWAKYLAPAYLLFLLVGSVVPLGMGAHSILMDNFTLEIRWDYLLHALVYLPLPSLLLFSFRKHGALQMWVIVGLIGFLVPVLFELVQMMIPYRSFNINDMVANGVGVLLGLIPGVFVWRRFLLG